MAKQNANKPILLLGAYGRGNAGDDVFLHCATSLFAGRPLYINSADDNLLPAQFRGKVSTISTTSPHDLLKKIKVYFSIREVVYWGGDLWVELYGTRTPRQLLYKMVLLNLLLRLTGKKIYYVGVGIGNLKGFSLFLARFSARLAKRIVVREQRSAQVIDLPQVSILPDLAINLPYHLPVRHKTPSGRPWVVAISILQSIPNPSENFPRLITQMAAFINSLPADKYTVVLVPMHITEAEKYDDLWASEQLLPLLRGRKVEMYTERDLEKIIAKLRSADVVIGGRLHTNILAALNGTPCIGIAYRPKVRSFFVDNGIADNCLDLAELERLPVVFGAIAKGYDQQARQFYEISQRNLARRRDYQELADNL